MKKTISCAVLAASVFALGSSAMAADTAAKAEAASRVDTLFAQLDLNKDGKISAMEYGAAARLAFNTMDVNKDSFVSPEEMTQARLMNIGHSDPRDPKSVLRIKTEDSNSDGMLSAEEHAATVRMIFNKLDKNHDGFLSRDELAAGVTSMAEHAGK